MIKTLKERLNLNTILGIMLILALFSLAGDNLMGSILSQVPGQVISEAAPCRWLPSPENLANHQSLIGRATLTRRNPIELTVRASGLPTPNSTGKLTVRIIVTNNSLGTIPFIYNPDEVIVGDNNTSGLGIIFNPPSNIFTPGINTRVDSATYPRDDVRILGPQQRCAHTLEFEATQLDTTLYSGNTQVIAYYRGNTSGVVPAANPTPIYPDQGLPSGTYITSSPVLLQSPTTAGQ